MKTQVEINVPVLVSTDVTMSVTLPLFLSTPETDEHSEQSIYYAVTSNDPTSRWAPYRIIETRRYNTSWKIYETVVDEKEFAQLLAKRHSGNLIDISRTQFVTLFTEAVACYASLTKQF